MSDPNDPLDPDEAEDPEDDLEQRMLGMDAPTLPTDRLTAEEHREPRSLDEQLSQERRAERRPGTHPVLIDHDAPDDEDELIAESTERADDLAPEEAAMRSTDEPPGATDDADDGYGDAAGRFAP